MRRLYFNLLLLTILPLTLHTANASSCFAVSVCPAYQNHPLVFRGRVISVAPAPPEPPRPLTPPSPQTPPNPAGLSNDPAQLNTEIAAAFAAAVGAPTLDPPERDQVRLQVLEVFKGEPGSEITILTGHGSFTPGEEYLVFSSSAKQGSIGQTTLPGADFCSPTHKLPANQSTLDPDLETLRAYLDPQGTGTLSGRLTFTADPLATSDVTIALTGATTQTIHTRPTEGRELFYLFKDLTPGTYTIAANPPQGTTATVVALRAMDSSPKTTSITVAGNSCSEVNWSLRYDSHIRGRVTNANGQPVANADVALVANLYPDQIARGRFAASKREQTNANGEYDFSGLDPGNYVVALNPHPPTADHPYAPAFYPSKSFIADAEVLHVDASASRDEINFVQPDALQPATVHVTALRANGTPIEDGMIIVIDPGSALSVTTAKTDRAGHADMQLFAGRQYAITASTPDPTGQPQEQPQCAGPIAFVASDNLTLAPLTPDKTYTACRSAPLPKPPPML